MENIVSLSSSSSVSENVLDQLWRLNENQLQKFFMRLEEHKVTKPDDIKDHLDTIMVTTTGVTKVNNETNSPPPRKKVRVDTSPSSPPLSPPPPLQLDIVFTSDVPQLIQQAIPALLDSSFFTPQEFGRLVLLTCKGFAQNLEGGKAHIYQRLLESIDTEDVPIEIRERMGNKWLLEQMVVKNKPLCFNADEHCKNQLLNLSFSSKYLEWEDLTLTLSLWKNNNMKLCSVTLEDLTLGLLLAQTWLEASDDVTFLDSDTLQVRVHLYRKDGIRIRSCSILHGSLVRISDNRIASLLLGNAVRFDSETDVLYRCQGPKLDMTDEWKASPSPSVLNHFRWTNLALAPLSFNVKLIAKEVEESPGCRTSLALQLNSPFQGFDGPSDFLHALDHMKGWSV